jgi:hypothetical protein
MVELDAERAKSALMRAAHDLDQRGLGDALLARAQHDGRAMGVVGAQVVHVVAAQALKRTQMSVCRYSTRWPRWM